VGMTLDEIIEGFQSVNIEMRLELLLDYSKQLPVISERYRVERDAGLHRVPECMSPVFLWMERIEGDGGGRIHIIADVAEEAPTVKGFLAIIIEAFDGRPVEEVRTIPLDLVHLLGLSSVIRMNRAQGISAIIMRIRRAAEACAVEGAEEVAKGAMKGRAD